MASASSGPEGDPLPSVEELLKQLGVSAATNSLAQHPSKEYLVTEGHPSDRGKVPHPAQRREKAVKEIQNDSKPKLMIAARLVFPLFILCCSVSLDLRAGGQSTAVRALMLAMVIFSSAEICRLLYSDS
jgi:hypothetical protein